MALGIHALVAQRLRRRTLSKGTTIRNVRVPDDLWGAALRYAEEQDTTVSDAIRLFLQAWVDGTITID